MLLASSPVAVVTSGSALTTGSNVTLDDLYMLLASINGCWCVLMNILIISWHLLWSYSYVFFTTDI